MSTNRNLARYGLSNVDFGFPFQGGGEFIEDFIAFGQNQLSTTATAGTWMVGGTNSATTLVDQMDVVTADGTNVIGAVEVATAATSGDDQYIQMEGAPFYCVAGRVMVFQVRWRPDTITTTTNHFGMYIPATVGATTTNPNDTQTNGFGFVVASGAIQYQVKNATTSVAAQSTTGTVAASTTTGWVTLKIVWDGIKTLFFYKDGQQIASYAGAAIPTGLYLSPVIGLSTASAVAKTMKVDYVACSVEGPQGGR